ncbi:ATS1 protein [Coniella lustricola]|uniref:ATS1 protein n=1 Tax=Coniella lustricola TaxID=2025994 RepID=A0A2T3A6G8_9PEZI|nr:ATS1 protein [Coniella lustricola]
MATNANPVPVLYALGSNGAGQLGIGHDQDVSIPRQVLFQTGAEPVAPIVKVAAGGNHTLLLARNGKLYWAGDCSTGACGPLARPQNANPPPFIVQDAVLPAHGEDGSAATVQFIAATWESSVITQCDPDGRATVVSTFGTGHKGELGQGQFIIRTPAITRIKDFPTPGTEIVDLSACMGHVVAVLSNGEVWGWGNGRKGQLGLNIDGVVYEPERIEGIDFEAARAVCGREFTMVFGRPESGKFLILGADKAGIKSSAPTQITGWRDVGASWGGAYILQDDGVLLSWGKDDHGQLAPPGLPKLANISVGSEHVVAITAAGDVLSWGWGEHGNCGPQVENNDVKGRWNTIASKKYIPLGSEIIATGAGCATSWISIEMAGQPGT